MKKIWNLPCGARIEHLETDEKGFDILIKQTSGDTFAKTNDSELGESWSNPGDELKIYFFKNAIPGLIKVLRELGRRPLKKSK